MSKSKSNWKAVAGLFLMGAVPALPGAYLALEILAGAPADGSAHPIVRMVYFENPPPILVHAAAGFAFAALMPFQFMPRLRRNGGRWHRALGRVTLFAAFTIALSAIWIILVFPPTAGPLKTAGLAVTAIGMLVAFGMAFFAIRRGRLAPHRAWMIRGVAVTFGAVTAVPVALPFALAQGGDVPQLADDLSRWVGTAANLLYVEIFVLPNRRRAGRALRKSNRAANQKENTAT